jgi:Spy/CpxP family protein refolding chaperone
MVRGSEMVSMKHSIRMSLVACAMSGIVGLSWAQSAPSAMPLSKVSHMHHPSHQHPFMRVLRQLNLTADQKTMVHAIYEEALPQMESLGKSTRDNMAQLMTTAPSDPGYAALVSAAKDNAAAHIQLISETQSHIYAVLTPEQQAKIPEVVAAMKASGRPPSPSSNSSQGRRDESVPPARALR